MGVRKSQPAPIATAIRKASGRSPSCAENPAAMGAITHGSVRVSFLHDATEADVDRLLEVLPPAVADLREMTELDTQAIERVAEGR